jgi:acyl carrier protein
MIASMDKAFDEIIMSVFKISEVRDDMTPNEIPDWDSMNYLRCIAELEERFGMSFTMSEVVEGKTVGDLRKAVRARGTL